MSADLLPRDSTTPFEAALVGAASRISAIPVPIATIKRAQETDLRTLTALGWEWSVNEWQSAWGDQRKRDVVDASPAVHRVLGTAGAQKRAIAALGYQVVVEEWFQHGGDPYTFRITVDLDMEPLTRADYLMLMRTALDAKNVRSHFEGFLARSRQPGIIRYGFGHAGTVEARFDPLEPPVYEYSTRIGVGIGVHHGTVTSTFEPLD